MDWLTWTWPSLIVRGILGILFGILAMVWPISTVAALAVLWGVWALVDGVGQLGQVREQGPSTGRLVMVVMGVVSILAGLIAVVSPGLTAVTLTWVLGIWLVVRGIVALGTALGGTTPVSRGLLVATGLVDLLIGVLFVANPGRAAVGIAVLLGATALIWGILFTAAGLYVRSRAPQRATGGV